MGRVLSAERAKILQAALYLGRESPRVLESGIITQEMRQVGSPTITMRMLPCLFIYNGAQKCALACQVVCVVSDAALQVAMANTSATCMPVTTPALRLTCRRSVQHAPLAT
jgi:hypothetical protein